MAPGPMSPPDSKRSDYRVGLITKARMAMSAGGSSKEAKTGKDSEREGRVIKSHRGRAGSSSGEESAGKGEKERLWICK